MSQRPLRHNTLWQIFALPLAAAVASLIGLVAALLGDGLLNALAWAGLAVPVALAGRAMIRKPDRQER